uniref:Uncharacterized protein n=1 Tax=Rhizophora mucronata TaxID=61149 RepID=A0A2P2KTZ3_RHIMU
MQQKKIITTSYSAPIRITPKSWTEALSKVSENSCLRIVSADCKKFHLHDEDTFNDKNFTLSFQGHDFSAKCQTSLRL